MKKAVAKEHRDFFRKNGWIEFENLLSNQEIEELNRAIDGSLSVRLSVPTEKIEAVSPEAAFLQGRDLWRSNDQLRKFVCLPRLGEVVSEIVELKPLRLGFDQFLPPCAVNMLPRSPSYAKFLHPSIELETMSSLRGMAAGLLIALDQTSEEVSAEGVDIFPKFAGNVSIFNPQGVFNFANLTLHLKQRFYLIVYTPSSSLYYQQPNDPHTHALKKYGYVYHDKLSDKLNPIVYR